MKKTRMWSQFLYWNGSHACSAVVLSAISIVLAGCSAGLAPHGSDATSVTPAAATGLHGAVHGGQQPVFGAVIQLYAVGISGVKSAATPLLLSSGGIVTTKQDGTFSITGDWDCTSNTAAYGTNPLLYITASGGNPGLTSGTNNAASIMVAALGPCSGVGAQTNINMNELTTVAAVYALAPFMADATHVGAQGPNAVGLVNAFMTANLLVNVSAGTAPGASAGANVSVPVSELDSLANALASCVNTSGTDGACAALFAAATPSGGTQPGDIVGAALSTVTNPAVTATAVFNRSGTIPPFQPTLSSAPNDWTAAVTFTNGGLAAPAGIALDAAGDVWVANAAGNSVTELSSIGGLLTGTSGYTAGGTILGAQGIALDKAGNVWIANTLASSVVQLVVSGGAVQSSATFSNGVAGPMSLAIDSGNHVWVSNFANGSITELDSTGAMVGAGPLTAGGTLQSPAGIAVDVHGNVWVADNAAWDVVEFSNTQALLSGTGYTDGAMVAPLGVAPDANGRVWIAGNGNNGASLLAAGGRPVLTAPLTGGGLAMPAAVAVDGAGVAWVVNGQTAGSLSELVSSQSTPLSPAIGYGILHAPDAIAIDASGSVWTANAGDNSVTEFVGLATPVFTPLAANVGP